MVNDGLEVNNWSNDAMVSMDRCGLMLIMTMVTDNIVRVTSTVQMPKRMMKAHHLQR